MDNKMYDCHHISSGDFSDPWEYPVFIWKYANSNQSYLAHLADVQLKPTDWQLFHSQK